MKRINVTKIFGWGLLAILLLVVIHAPISVVFSGVFPEYPKIIRAWKEIGLVLLGLIAVVLITRRRLWRELLHDPLVLLSLAYIDIHLLLAIVMGGDGNAVIAGLMIDLRFIAMFVLMYVAAKLRPEILPTTLRIVAAGAVIVLGFGLLQITVLPDDILSKIGYSKETIAPFITVDTNPDFVRINSTMRGPNPLGALTIVYGALALAYLIRRGKLTDIRQKLIGVGTLIASGAVLFATYSRSAYVAFIAALAVVCVAGRHISKRVTVVGAAGLVVAVGLLTLLSSTDWFSNVILHEDPESLVVSKSNDEHAASLREGAKRMVAQPLGAGVGSTGSASLYDKDVTNDIIIENYYFFVAHEIGWLGLATFIGLFGMILVKLWCRRSSWLVTGVFASGIGLALVGLLLPVWTDDTVSLVWWGLAGAVLAAPHGIIGGRHGRTTRKQKTTGTA